MNRGIAPLVTAGLLAPFFVALADEEIVAGHRADSRCDAQPPVNVQQYWPSAGG